MSPAKFITFAILVVYLSAILFLFFNINNLDFPALTDRFSKKSLDGMPGKAGKSLSRRDSLRCPAFGVPDTLPRGRVRTQGQAPLVFDSLDEVLVYAATLDGTLNSAKPIIRCFAGS
jgi:hypothetical protein